MKNKKFEAEHWMIEKDPNVIPKAKKKVLGLALWGLAGLVMSAGSFAILAIPGISPFLIMGGLLSGTSFITLTVNCARKASLIQKDIKNDKVMKKCLTTPSVDKLSKKELEVYHYMFPKSELVHIEPITEKVKSDYSLGETIIES